MFQFIIWIVTAPFRFAVLLFKTWKWYIAGGILAVITITGVVIFMVTTAKKPAPAVPTMTTQAPTIPNDIQAPYMVQTLPLLLRWEGNVFQRRLRPHSLLVLQYFIRSMGKIRFSHYHTELRKDWSQQKVDQERMKVCLYARVSTRDKGKTRKCNWSHSVNIVKLCNGKYTKNMSINVRLLTL